MIIWILILVTTTLMFFLEWSFKLKKDVKRMFSFLYLLTIDFLIGFRYKIGWDYDNYILMMDGKSWDKKTVEILSLLIFEGINYFKLNKQMFFLITTIIFIFCLSKFIQEFSKYYYLSFLVYFLDARGFITQASTVRQSLAIGCFLYSLIYIVKKNQLLKGYCILLIGIFFHISIIFTIPFIMLRKIRVKNYYFLFAPIFLIIINLVFKHIIKILGGRYNYYLYADFGAISQVKLVIVNLLIYLIVIYKKEKRKNEKDELYNLFKIGVLLYPFCMLYSAVLGRLTEYFTILIIIFLPNVIMSSKINFKKIVSFLILIIMLGSYVLKGVLTKQQNSKISADNYNYKLNIKLFNEEK